MDPRTLQAVALMLVLVPSATPSVEADSAGPLAEAIFDYRGGGAASGRIEGEMDIYHARFLSENPGLVQVKDAKARLFVVASDINTTHAGGRPINADSSTPHQETRWIDLEGPSLGIQWPHEEALSLLYGAPWPFEKIRPMRVQVAAEMAEWGPTQKLAVRDAFLFPADLNAWEYGGFAAWHRPLELRNGSMVAVEAPFVFHLRGAAVTATDDQGVDLGPFRVLVEELRDPFGTVVRQTVRYTEALLFVDEGSMMLPADGIEFAVGGADLNVTGDLVVHSATGMFRVGSHADDFSHQSLGLSGVFRLEDRAPDDGLPSYERSGMSAAVEGSFDVVAVDYIVAAAPVDGVSLAQRVLWITVALAVLAFLAKLLQHLGVALYSRIQEDAVLENPRRAEIMRFVDANPGCNVTRVAGELAMARGVTRHHLMVLERAGKIRRLAQAGQVSVYPAGLPPSTFRKAIAAGDARLAYVVSLLDTGAIPRAHLVERLRSDLGVSDPAARRCIAKAQRLGLIEASGSGRSVAYRPAS